MFCWNIYLALLQQKEREIVSIEECIRQIEINARQEYITCQSNIMRYSQENNNFLKRFLYHTKSLIFGHVTKRLTMRLLSIPHF